MALIYSRIPCEVAGTFTTNVVKAAPVKWDQSVVYGGGSVHAVVVNSGVANACTGEEGLGYCKQTAEKGGGALWHQGRSGACGFYGVIGAQIPINKIRAGIETMQPMLAHTQAAATLAAEAIMTTDTVKKGSGRRGDLRRKDGHDRRYSKGSGMIHPNMCTMLSFVTTDAAISKKLFAESTECKRTGYIQYDICGWRYVDQ